MLTLLLGKNINSKLNAMILAHFATC